MNLYDKIIYNSKFIYNYKVVSNALIQLFAIFLYTKMI